MSKSIWRSLIPLERYKVACLSDTWPEVEHRKRLYLRGEWCNTHLKDRDNISEYISTQFRQWWIAKGFNPDSIIERR